jgi:hypothetical protein
VTLEHNATDIDACQNIKGNVRRQWLVTVIARAEDEILLISRLAMTLVQLYQPPIPEAHSTLFRKIQSKF